MIMKNQHTYVILILLFSFLARPLDAQEKNLMINPDNDYHKGLELFENEKYGSAQVYFQKVIDYYEDQEVENKSNAEYYSAICAVELYHADAEYLISQFIAKYPESSKVNEAKFVMGKFQYRNKRYKDAIFWLDQVDNTKMTDEEVAELYFKRGYSYFMLNDFDRAGTNFYEIKDKRNTYSAPAVYYYAHIAYHQKNYETALQGFQRLSDNPTFAPVVPYYITHIFYFQGKYDEVIEYAEPLIESAAAARLSEIAKIIGDSYYRKKDFTNALKYFEIHKENSDNLSREDYYQLGYAYYYDKQYDSAIVSFQKVSDTRDRMAQNTYFHLADCYLSIGNKEKARVAFEFAAKDNFDLEIKEEALFNYALLTYELYHSPFNEAIDAFHDFIKIFPNSTRIDDAYNFLVMAYMYTSNYKEALKSLEKIDDKDHTIKEAYQKVAYFRGLELYNNLHFEEAIETFDKSLQFSEYNKKIAAQCHYWKAEAMYQLEKYEESIKEYQEFILTGGAFQLQEYNMAHYNLGYSYFKLKDYSNAIQWFRKYVGFSATKKDKVLADTYNRIGDCYFISKTYWVAIEYYDKAIEVGKMDTDYAIFQRGFALGLVKRPAKKIETLDRIIRDYPKSEYLDDALFESAKSHLALNNVFEARNHYKRIVDEYPNSSYVKKSLVQLGLISFNNNENVKALNYYKQVVAEFPGTSEARNALVGIKNIYIELNDVDSYFAYVDGLGGMVNVSVSEQDSLSYIAAENVYMKGDCESAVEMLKKYLQTYSEGSFVVNANFYIADCYNRTQREIQALEYYNFVIERPKNTFTEQALIAAAEINFNEASFLEALSLFDQLEKVAEVNQHLVEARTGMMRCNYYLENYEDAITAADKVLHTEKISQQLIREAHYKKGKSLMNTGNHEMAVDEFRIISTDVNSREGAEAKYLIAKIFFDDAQLEKAEEEIFDFVKQNTSQEYWLARSFILLADIYLERDDFFQAKHTLKSIIDNYTSDEDDIITTAEKKLKDIIEKEKENAPEEEKTDMEIKLNEQTGEYELKEEKKIENPDSLINKK